MQTEVHPGTSPASGDVHRLRAQVDRMQGRRLDAPVLPALPALAALLPGGGLRAGSAYSIAPSASLLSALLAAPSQAGSWCGVVGMPQFGAEAAEGLGVDLVAARADPRPRIALAGGDGHDRRGASGGRGAPGRTSDRR